MPVIRSHLDSNGNPVPDLPGLQLARVLLAGTGVTLVLYPKGDMTTVVEQTTIEGTPAVFSTSLRGVTLTNPLTRGKQTYRTSEKIPTMAGFAEWIQFDQQGTSLRIKIGLRIPYSKVQTGVGDGDHISLDFS